AFAWIAAALLLPCILAYTLTTSNEAAVTGIVFACVAVIAVFARPFWGLLFTLALFYMRPEETFPALEGMHFTMLVSVVTLLGMCIQMALNRQSLQRSPLNWTM